MYQGCIAMRPNNTKITNVIVYDDVIMTVAIARSEQLWKWITVAA